MFYFIKSTYINGVLATLYLPFQIKRTSLQKRCIFWKEQCISTWTNFFKYVFQIHSTHWRMKLVQAKSALFNPRFFWINGALSCIFYIAACFVKYNACPDRSTAAFERNNLYRNEQFFSNTQSSSYYTLEKESGSSKEISLSNLRFFLNNWRIVLHCLHSTCFVKNNACPDKEVALIYRREPF